MNVLDGIIIIILVYFGYRGVKNGLLREVLGLAGVVIGLFLAFRYLEPFNLWMINFTGVNDQWSPFIAFFIIFFSVIVVAQLAIILLEKLMEFAFLSVPNRIAGLVFGLVKSCLFISLFLLLLAGMNVPGEETRRHSVFYSFMISFAPTVYDVVGNFYPGTEDFAASVQRTLDEYHIDRFKEN